MFKTNLTHQLKYYVKICKLHKGSRRKTILADSIKRKNKTKFYLSL